jgi:predicted NBD/HSP70 family sugar kinase
MLRVMADMPDIRGGEPRFSAHDGATNGAVGRPGAAATGASTGAGAMLRLIRDGRASTRAELVALTGLARSTVAQRMDTLLAQRLVVPAGSSASTGGRPPKTFAFNRNAGAVLAADLGATHARLAITDLAGDVMVQRRADVAIAQGPDAVLNWLEETFDALLAESGQTRADVRGIGLGIPGPVEFATGTPVAPPIMPGWDGYPVAARLRDRYGALVLVDNDVNIMALGEYWSRWRDTQHLLFVKVGTGIGCGAITDGRIHRGAQGAAGDIGHIHVPDHDDVICSCGNLGCLEAVAGGGAMAARLSQLGIKAEDGRDVVRHVREGRPEAMRLVRQAGRELGGVLASAVNFFNPAVIVIGGDIAHADEHLLAGVREVVYRRSTALATRSIRIARSTLDDGAGVIGAAVMVIEAVLAPDAVDQAIAAAAG